MKIIVKNGELNEKELAAYQDRAVKMYGDALEAMTITVEEDYVNIDYKLKEMPFERIRRITGYLVGTMDRWNDAKKAEESERVKHGF